MSSGLDWDEAYNSLFSQTTQAYYGNNLREQMMKLKVIEQPGKQFKYLSCNTQLLAFIIEKATGKTVSQYAAEKLWIPMGASKEALWSLDKENGDEKAYCCFNSTARDFARIGQLVLNKGNWNGQQLISEKYIIESTTPAKNLTDIDNKPIDSYGFHWWLMKYKEKDVIYARGILGQYIIIIPSENTVIVRLGHRRSKEKINNHPTDIYTWIKTAMELE
jgi:CubicO group peptidase (beta-lactamase class C family)